MDADAVEALRAQLAEVEELRAQLASEQQRLAVQLAAGLPLWDRYCPDDGRLAVGLAAARAYLAAPVKRTAAYRLETAWYGVLDLVAGIDPTPDPPALTRYLAWSVAETVRIFLSLLLSSSIEDTQAEVAEARALVAAINGVLASLGYAAGDGDTHLPPATGR